MFDVLWKTNFEMLNMSSVDACFISVSPDNIRQKPSPNYPIYKNERKKNVLRQKLLKVWFLLLILE